MERVALLAAGLVAGFFMGFSVERQDAAPDYRKFNCNGTPCNRIYDTCLVTGKSRQACDAMMRLLYFRGR